MYHAYAHRATVTAHLHVNIYVYVHCTHAYLSVHKHFKDYSYMQLHAYTQVHKHVHLCTYCDLRQTYHTDAYIATVQKMARALYSHRGAQKHAHRHDVHRSTRPNGWLPLVLCFWFCVFSYLYTNIIIIFVYRMFVDITMFVLIISFLNTNMPVTLLRHSWAAA